MTRSRRVLWLPLALLAALSLAAGAALARSDAAPDSPAQVLADEPSPEAQAEGVSAENVDRIVGLLADAGIETDADAFTALATDLGVGGAVRALAWADATADAADGATTADEIATMRADGMGWGVIRKELDPDGELGLHPGIGWIMRGASSSETVSVTSDGAVTDAAATTEAAGGGKDHGKGKPDNPGQHGRDQAAAHSSGN